MVSPIQTLPILLTFLLMATASAVSFPHILWIYWEQGIQSAPLFTQLCIRNKQTIARQSGWELRLLSSQNLHLYIDPQQVDRIARTARMLNLQFKADVIRLLLLEQHGGMWMDANTLLLTPLNWTDALPSLSYVRNKIEGSPEMMMGAFTPQHKEMVDGIDLGSLKDQGIVQLPNYQNWFLLAQPHALFLKDCLMRLIEVVEQQKETADAEYRSQGIHFLPTILNPYFVASDYLFQVVVQSKQLQLTHNNISTPAFQHYRIWHLEAAQTVFAYFEQHSWKNLVVCFALAQSTQSTATPFLKFVGWQHPTYTEYFNNYAAINCWTDYPLLISNQSIWHKSLLAGAEDIPAVRAIFQFNQQYASGNSSCAQQLQPPQIHLILLQFGPLLLTLIFVWSCFACCNVLPCFASQQDTKVTALPQDDESTRMELASQV